MNKNSVSAFLLSILRERPGYFELHDGLTNAEVRLAEEKFDFLFPPDLRDFLKLILPISVADQSDLYPGTLSKFPNWQDLNSSLLRERIDQPMEGLLFDVEHNLWHEFWGTRPPAHSERVAVVRNLVTQAPKLIPIFAHRYISSEPYETGNSIISVHQGDIIYYGSDLQEYFDNEFNRTFRFEITKPKPIRFWSQFI